MGVLARRYPAIDLSEVPLTLMALATGIKRMNWITLVGAETMAEKGMSVAELTDLESYALPHGVAIVAGGRPLLGDVNRQEDLGAYHRVGHVVARLRSTDHGPFVCDQQGDPQDDRTDEWLGYFDV
jgi:hypothetical protein